MDQSPPLDYATVCRYVGQLFLETRHELERLNQEAVVQREKLVACEAERNKSLQLLMNKKEQ